MNWIHPMNKTSTCSTKTQSSNPVTIHLETVLAVEAILPAIIQETIPGEERIQPAAAPIA